MSGSSPGIPRRPPKSHVQVLYLSFLVACIGLGTMVTLGFLLHVSVVMRPTLLDRIFPEARLCKEMNNYVKDQFDGEDRASNYQQLQEHKSAYTNHGMLTLEATRERSSLVRFTGETEEREEDRAPLDRPFRVLIGIMTMAKSTERRHLLRMAYRAQSTDIADVEVKFVIGKMHDELDRTLVGLENLVYHDIMELDCEENMNHGKTFTFFSTAAEKLKGIFHFHYVMKTDDDSYVRIENLARHLSPLPRTDLYYGYILPCENQDPHKWYMAGMGYVISWDLVEWIKDSPIPRNDNDGTEDQLVGKWFDEGGKAKNRVNDKPLFYDHPAFGGKCAHELLAETILIHQVKTSERWRDVLSFFENDRLNMSLSSLRIILTQSH